MVINGYKWDHLADLTVSLECICIFNRTSLSQRSSFRLIQTNISSSKMHLSTPSGLGCCPFLGGGSGVVDSLLVVTPVWDFVIVLCVGMHYFVSILVLQSY